MGAETPAAPLEKAVAQAEAFMSVGHSWDGPTCIRALEIITALLAALDADRGEAEARLQAVLDYEPKEVCKDEFAYDRMVEAYRKVARRYFARRERKEVPE